eukprot:TRINITY_DN106130_c0_g1_i1.p1 TRINITY_DN106130_c0_g1~~TRINITY_DN106130_c0_g1_i1.p1  ORF type:complete len:309 (-),score=13.72 TRINITY_DN106130_c0_g1_i1:27-953(-)
MAGLRRKPSTLRRLSRGQQSLLALVMTLLAAGGGVLWDWFNGRDAWRAAEVGDLKTLQNLAQSLTVPNSMGVTPILVASVHGHLQVVQYLVHERGANILQENKDGWLAVHFSSAYGHLNTVKWLCEQDTSCLSRRTAEGFNPLQVACQQGQLEVVRYLVTLSNPADLEWPPHLVAAHHKQWHVMQWLLTNRWGSLGDIGPDGRTALLVAVLNGNLTMVKWLSNEDHSVLNLAMKAEHTGGTPLVVATMAGHQEIVEWLLDPTGGDVPCETQQWPLVAVAKRYGHEALARWLVGRGCPADNNGEQGGEL